MTGRDSDLKKYAKSKNYLSKILNCVKIKEIFRSTKRGSILIEFAVCMPVLIVPLYYINDLSKLKRYYDQTEFVAQQTVNMIQNISQKRAKEATTAEERETLFKVSKKDLLHIHTLAWQTVYPGLTIFRKNSVYPLNHKPITSTYYVE